MDLIFRILTTADSRPSITWKLLSVTPCGFRHSFWAVSLPALLPPRSFYSFCSRLSAHLALLAALCRVQLQALAFFSPPPFGEKSQIRCFLKALRQDVTDFILHLKASVQLNEPRDRNLHIRFTALHSSFLSLLFPLYPFALVLLPFFNPPLSRSPSCHPYTQLCKNTPLLHSLPSLASLRRRNEMFL